MGPSKASPRRPGGSLSIFRPWFGEAAPVALTLHYHPLASSSWKPTIALYELEIPFERVIVDYADEASRAQHFALWPMGKIPVLRDAGRDETVPEASVIIEYLD